uniref:Stereocilin LRR domain-containing protein n=1 Tax=Cynoglossus semilaevis TaxID=244447 RepID=A0A3P8UST0_CYNSE
MEFKVPASPSRNWLEAILHLLPLMGVTFLQGLTPTQLLNVLPALGNVSFSPVQASVIVDKLSSVTRLTAADKLENLGSLTAGMQAEELLKLTSGQLLQFLPSLAHHSPCRSPPQAIAIATKLWGYPQVVTWLDNNDVDPLLYCTPLMSVLPRIPVLVNMTQNITTNPFNTQQAKDIFTKALDIHPNLIKENILKLGTLGQGLSCQMLKEYLQDDTSLSGVRKVLIFLQQQTRPLHISLKKCVIEELYQLPFFSQLLRYLSAEISLSMPLSVITKFTKADMDILRKTIIQEPHHFLLLPRSKQTLLVDKMVERMNMNTGPFTGEEFQSLGIMAPFVADEVFSQIDRSFFLAKLPFLLGLCYTRSKMSLVAAILQEPVVFGPTKKWNYSTVLQVDRFLFFLSDTSLQDISLDLVPLGYLEKLFIKQRHWESGDVGANCLTEDERISFFQRQQFVLQFFLGYLKIDPHSSWSPFIPSCAVMHSIPPAAWTPSSLLSMSSVDFYNCLELMGRDPYIANYQRSQLLNKVKKIFGPVFSFSQPVISQLGALAKEMTEEELSSLHLVERRSIAALGAVQGWSQKQLAVLSSRVFNSTKQTPIQLDSSTLVAMGHILCGAKSTNLSSLNAVEFSKAALFLGQLQLACSEEQLEVFVRLLTHPLAFGPISSWGTGVFIEIGVLAAGITDFAMSALVREQIEGMTPEAISRIPPERFYVALNQRQISMFSYEQAAAVTNEQYNILSEVQKTALSMALTPWENRPVDFRGRSGALSLSHSPVCLTLGLLMLLFVLHGPAQ